MEESFGPHITIDLKGCPKDILSNYELHFDYLKKLPDLIQMTPITQPYVFPYSGLIPSDRGITGIVIIAESHLSVHSFEEKGYSFIDIFSCKDFDVDSYKTDNQGNRIGHDFVMIQKLVAANKKIVHHPELTWIYHVGHGSTLGMPVRW